ncbi:hypothetical protein [Sigmofec virus UA08Rod_5365]|uniref:Uncharacterized protein n=1 Tax=Sigmofec virus UA08Rod_5365 TaxID=2929422 RepID=A0A976R806_9VIRU|nr:hypothetical protein [Sigmofec virus UA08Rod_5365]
MKEKAITILYDKWGEAEIERMKLLKKVWVQDTIINDIKEKLKKYGEQELRRMDEERLFESAQLGSCIGDRSYHWIDGLKL